MPIVMGAAASYSPFLYRDSASLPELAPFLIGDVTQPASRLSENEACIKGYRQRVAACLDRLSEGIAAANLDALIVLMADRQSVFDLSNTPQLHIQVGGEISGDSAISEIEPESRRKSFACDEKSAELLIEELVYEGFDVSEGRHTFAPIDAGRGLNAAALETVARLARGIPIVPVHVNCHVPPLLPGWRLHAFGRAIAKASALSTSRLGVLVAGGLSGDPRGPMAGWIDDVLDRWVLTRLERQQSERIAEIWNAQSRTLIGNSAEIRLWMAAGAALEVAGMKASVLDYMPFHHAAAGIGFVLWECR